ncbi:DUF4913 domain-containing protein [Kocuria sp. cx-455]|uniref:DUF4913 domain-containing protein n=1 Tax=Kocuria sp. cx-455 TaxID=2771377 RepID=UPI001CC23D0E|nr:DUF4913 domain-containing protein [Kocuria sp. cx-455]
MNWEEEAAEGNEDVEEQPPTQLFYANVAQFVTEQLASVYRRDVDMAGRSMTFTWCAQWGATRGSGEPFDGVVAGVGAATHRPVHGIGRVVA